MAAHVPPLLRSLSAHPPCHTHTHFSEHKPSSSQWPGPGPPADSPCSVLLQLQPRWFLRGSCACWQPRPRASAPAPPLPRSPVSSSPSVPDLTLSLPLGFCPAVPGSWGFQIRPRPRLSLTQPCTSPSTLTSAAPAGTGSPSCSLPYPWPNGVCGTAAEDGSLRGAVPLLTKGQSPMPPA